MPPSKVRPSFRQSTSVVSDRTLLTIVGERDSRPDPNSRLLDITTIERDPRQARKAFPEDSLRELQDSIASVGMLQPIVVRKSGASYVLISGERRYRAAMQLGMREIPAVVREFTEDDAQIAGLIENLQRLDISPEDEAAAFDSLLQARGLGVRELSRLIHKDPGYISRRVRVYEDAELGPIVRSGKVAVSTAERILAVKDADLRAELVSRAAAGTLDQQSARSLVRGARQFKADPIEDAQPEPASIETAALPDPDPVEAVVRAIEALVKSGSRPTPQQRFQLRAMNDRLFDWLILQGPLPWTGGR